jgi:hypothetical protein
MNEGTSWQNAGGQYHACYGPGCQNAAWSSDPFCLQCWNRMPESLQRQVRQVRLELQNASRLGIAPVGIRAYLRRLDEVLGILDRLHQLEYEEGLTHAYTHTG